MKRAFVPEDILKFEGISCPLLSYDGQVVYFVKEEPLTDENRRRSAIFTIHGKEPAVKITDWELNARNPRLAPNGRLLSFNGKRDGKSALYLIELVTGRVTALQTDLSISTPAVWSDDSRKLAFVSKTFQKDEGWLPYAGAPLSDSFREEVEAGVSEVAEGSYKSDIKVIAKIKYRMNEAGYLGNRTNQVYITEIPEDLSSDWTAVRQITGEDLDHGYPVFSPGGEEVFCTRFRGIDFEGISVQDLVRVNTETLKVTLAVEGKGSMSNLALSPDGKELAFWATDRHDPDLWFDNIYVYPCHSSGTLQLAELENATGSFYRQLGKMPSSGERMRSLSPLYEWLGDQSGFLLLFCDGGASGLTEIHRGENGRGLIIWQDRMRSVTAFSKRQGKYALMVGSMSETDQLVLFDGKEENILIRTNEWIRDEIDLAAGQRFEYLGADGLPMQGWLLTPPSLQGPNPPPAVLFIHGGPHGVYGSSFMFQTQLLASNGYTVAYVNPRGSSSYGFDFANKVYLDWGGGDYMDIMAGMDWLVREGYADSKRLGITGWSYGGYMSSWALTRTDRFRAAVIGAPVTNRHSMYGTSDIGFNFNEKHAGGNPWDSPVKLLDRSPLNYAYRINTPVLLIHGEADYRCPVSQSEELFIALKRQGKEAVMVRYPDEPHNFKQLRHLEDRYRRTLCWFDHYLKQ